MSNVDGGAICYVLEVLSSTLYRFRERVVFRELYSGYILRHHEVKEMSQTLF